MMLKTAPQLEKLALITSRPTISVVSASTPATSVLILAVSVSRISLIIVTIAIIALVGVVLGTLSVRSMYYRIATVRGWRLRTTPTTTEVGRWSPAHLSGHPWRRNLSTSLGWRRKWRHVELEIWIEMLGNWIGIVDGTAGVIVALAPVVRWSVIVVPIWPISEFSGRIVCVATLILHIIPSKHAIWRPHTA
jgi:hypothetical protein